MGARFDTPASGKDTVFSDKELTFATILGRSGTGAITGAMSPADILWGPKAKFHGDGGGNTRKDNTRSARGDPSRKEGGHNARRIIRGEKLL